MMKYAFLKRNPYRVVDRCAVDYVLCECDQINNAMFIAHRFNDLFNGTRVVQRFDELAHKYVDLDVF